jgi:hypothetical protein
MIWVFVAQADAWMAADANARRLYRVECCNSRFVAFAECRCLGEAPTLEQAKSIAQDHAEVWQRAARPTRI